MRGKFLSILASVLCVGEIAMAAVPLNSIALGGIVPGMTKGDVERIYGSCKYCIHINIPLKAKRILE